MEATILLSTLKKKFKGKVLMQGLVGFAFVHTIMNSLTFFFFKFLVSTIFLVHNNLSLKGSPLSNMPFIRYTSAPCQYNYLENKYLNFFFLLEPLVVEEDLSSLMNYAFSWTLKLVEN